MLKIDFIDFPIEDMVRGLFFGEKIYRINMENLAVVDLGDKSVNTMIRDEQKNPDKYAYFVVKKDEVKDSETLFRCATTGLRCSKCISGPCENRYEEE